ncbi:MAG TPA: hypothetical protein VFA76_01835 [Terriglobales bacterium]|nr:hypothetical protein [Terriglobales bacterium]
MFTGTMIDQLMATVAKVEEHSHFEVTPGDEAAETAYYAIANDYTPESSLAGVA